MKARNLFLLLITSSNLILILCISLLNSLLGPLGVFLFLPGLFFLPHYQLLDSYRCIFCLLVSGFLVDHFFNYVFGFHAFLFAVIYFVSKEFFHIGKQSFKQILIYQLSANLILALVWLLYTGIAESNYSAWGFRRFFSDFLISSILMIPLSLWYSQFCNQVLYRFGSSSLPHFATTK